MPFLQWSFHKLLQDDSFLWNTTFIPHCPLLFYQFLTFFVRKIESKCIAAVGIRLTSRKLGKSICCHISHCLASGICQVFILYRKLHRADSRNLQESFDNPRTHKQFSCTTHITVLTVKVHNQYISFNAVIHLHALWQKTYSIRRVSFLTVHPLHHILKHIVCSCLLRRVAFLLKLSFIRADIVQIIFGILFTRIFMYLHRTPGRKDA